jgi:hypothetical protein
MPTWIMMHMPYIAFMGYFYMLLLYAYTYAFLLKVMCMCLSGSPEKAPWGKVFYSGAKWSIYYNVSTYFGMSNKGLTYGH